MPVVNFFNGTQEKLDLAKNNNSLLIGSLYFTDDTKRLYKAISNNDYQPVDEQVIFVDVLPDILEGEKNKLYLVNTEMILYAFDGAQFNKLSSNSINSVFEKDIPTISALGGIKAGTDLSGLTALEILDKLLFPYIAPDISVTSTPNGGTYEKGNNQLMTNVSVKVVKRSEDIIKIELYDDEGTLLESLENNTIASGGTFSFSVMIDISSNKQLTAKVTDSTNNTIEKKTATFNFVYPYYVGICNADSEINETLITSLTKSVTSKENKSVQFTTNKERMIFAYPKTYGKLSKILDQNSFDVTGTFNITEVKIHCLDETDQDYYVYVNESSTVNNFTMKFNY